jgi:hypothetical protein
LGDVWACDGYVVVGVPVVSVLARFSVINWATLFFLINEKAKLLPRFKKKKNSRCMSAKKCNSVHPPWHTKAKQFSHPNISIKIIWTKEILVEVSR